MTSYFSLLYLLVFLPAVTLLYQILPQKHRWKVLLGASYLFFLVCERKAFAVPCVFHLFDSLFRAVDVYRAK